MHVRSFLAAHVLEIYRHGSTTGIAAADPGPLPIQAVAGSGRRQIDRARLFLLRRRREGRHEDRSGLLVLLRLLGFAIALLLTFGQDFLRSGQAPANPTHQQIVFHKRFLKKKIILILKY
jgi:hypothetical protein